MADFSELEPLLHEWGLPTTRDRVVKRMNSSFEELEAFHAAMSPRLEEIIQFLNQFPLDAIPEEHRPLAWTALAMCEVDDAVSKWGAPTSPGACSPLRFSPKKNFNDTKPRPSGID